MGAKKITFKQLFDTEETRVIRVLIPRIQRAYAQGRTDKRTTKTRKTFLNAIHNALKEGKPLMLDFIYGNIKEDKPEEGLQKPGSLIPLDGQQRLTTLFLLHWYAAKKEYVAEDEYAFLANFSYETRYSARDFCTELVKFQPSSDYTSLRDNGGKWTLAMDIENQSWFPLDWKHDPTIAAMLVMLDDIDERFSDISGLWGKLDYVAFYFLSIDEMKQTDDIYIKMNSRGKPLTDFEHFKAELEKVAKETNKEMAERIMHKIDIEWTDMLWQFRSDEKCPDDKNNDIIDDEFMRYFRFVCDILCYRSNGSPDWKKDEFELLKLYFKGDNALENFKMFEEFFDCWCGCGDIKALFSHFLSKEHEPNKVVTRHTDYGFNLFESCLHEYGEMQSDRNRKFALNQTVLLYAFIDYIQNKNKETISETVFIRRLRIVGNLIKNSSDEISDSENRTSGNRIPAILKQVDSIIIKGVVSDDITIGENSKCLNFNGGQLEEEREKLIFTDTHSELAESLFTLEDHELLTGQIGIVGIENTELFPTFAKLFKCDWDLVDCALLAIGNYSQRDNEQRIQLGSSNNDQAWKNLFHKSRYGNGYDNTKKCLVDLLSRSATPTDDALRAIVDTYIDECEREERFDWRYYYVKYRSFRADRYGKYVQRADKPYEMTAMHAPRKVSGNAYQVYLKEISTQAGLGEIDRENKGNRLAVSDKYVYCENSAIVINDSTDNNVDFREIEQDGGIDIENRVETGAKYLTEYFRA